MAAAEMLQTWLKLPLAQSTHADLKPTIEVFLNSQNLVHLEKNRVKRMS
jgi:hypothetical protein